MQIKNVISGLTDPMTWGKKNESAAQASPSAVKQTEPQTLTNQATQRASVEILKKYDVTHISPDEFSLMVQKLYKTGVLTERDYQELSAARADLEHAGVEPNEPVNMLEFFSDKVSKTQKEIGTTLDEAALQKRFGPDMRRLDWLQKFAMVQANPDAVGLDMAA
jgi:hypothetical protein